MPQSRDFSRCERFATQIQRELAPIMQENLMDKNYPFVSITAMKVTPDLSIAKIYISIMEQTKVNPTLNFLRRNSQTLRFELAQRLNLRRTPELHFYYDEVLAYGNKLTKLIDEAVDDDAKDESNDD